MNLWLFVFLEDVSVDAMAGMVVVSDTESDAIETCKKHLGHCRIPYPKDVDIEKIGLASDIQTPNTIIIASRW